MRPGSIPKMNHSSHPGQAGARVSYGRYPNYTYSWSLRPAWRATLFLLLLVSVCSWLAYQVIRVAWVTNKLQVFSIPEVKTAIRLDPENADLRHWLGLVYTSVPTEINPEESVKNLREAVRLNPGRWDFWSDLGTSCDFLGDTACADDAFSRAESLNPWTPALEWALGNHYLLTDRAERAFPYFHQLLEKDPGYLDATFRLCLRAVGDPQAIYAGVVPQGKDPTARFAFLTFLASKGEYDDAMKIWGKMISGTDRSPRLTAIKPFLDLLIEHNRIADASMVWTDLSRSGIIPSSPRQTDGNLLYDPDLQMPPLNTGFAWRMSEYPEIQLELSDSSCHRGPNCLQIYFAVGRNAEYDLLDQVVLVKPNTNYRLTASVRSDSLSSDAGPRLRVVELGCGNCPARMSDPTLGTTPWHPVEITFETQPLTQAVKISFWRPQGNTSTGDITGTVWLDDLLLRAVETNGSGGSPARGK